MNLDGNRLNRHDWSRNFKHGSVTHHGWEVVTGSHNKLRHLVGDLLSGFLSFKFGGLILSKLSVLLLKQVVLGDQGLDQSLLLVEGLGTLRQLSDKTFRING